jgi:glutathione S-transferase
MKLYANPFSTAAFKVFAILQELGLPCEHITIDMMKGQHKSPEYLAVNPNGKVPTLVDGDFQVWESNAILTYLAAKHPERGLMPTDAKGLALVQQWLQWQASQFSPAANKVMFETVYAKFFGRTTDEAKLATALEELKKELAVLEKSLAGKEYLCGRLSIADFSIASMLLARQPMRVDLSGFPLVKAWQERLEMRESMRKVLPPV